MQTNSLQTTTAGSQTESAVLNNNRSRIHEASLDNISHPGTLAPNELVPSRYARRIGEIDVLVISDGVLPIPAETIASNVDPTVRTAWLDNMFLPPDVLDWPLNVVVLRTGDRTILVDAGLAARVRTPIFGRSAI